ncbi:MAG TPA: peptidase M61 [Rhodanobacteraceae bacterium]|nr:peptidase M61 [Rhodanobacteraceae bacterium]
MSFALRRSSSLVPTRLAVALALALVAGSALADAADANIPPPQDTPYHGTITLSVDASDTSQGIFRAHETIPVQAGELTLLYPKWLPGNHSPSGPIDKLAGLKISANGKPLAWTRDKYDVFAFHVDVPQGVSSIDLDYQFLSPRTRSEGRIVMTDAMLNLQWNAVVLYPAGHYSREITYAPSVKLPDGWQLGTALETQSKSGDTVTFKPTPLNTLVDSPIYAGEYFKRVDLDPGAKVPVHLDIVADAPKYLEMNQEQLQAHRNLVTQAYKLFDSYHYNHYDFLFSLSDQMSGNGLEHHQSSEDGTGADYFTDWKSNAPGRDLLAHEYTHSWNGKFRRPADLWTPNFNVPMGDSLLWVYEGQTQYWGFVLAARSGLWNPDEFKDALALVAATYQDNRPGFDWRNVQDTTNDPTIAQRAPLPYRNYQMSEDYYSAGQLIWLAVDSKIRSLTNDKKSLDDFASAFFGVHNGSFVTDTYTFDDIVAALNGVAKYDWATFLRSRLDAHQPPMDGIAASGWKLVYTDKPSDYEKSLEKNRKFADFTYSLGLTLSAKDGGIGDVRWNSPAFKAGISPGAELVAVNGHAFKPEVLKDAITAAKSDNKPIELLIKHQDEYKMVPVDYHGGLRYPHLERASGPDYLSQIIKAK